MGDNPNQPASLAEIIGWVESRNNCSAVRFEPSIWEKLSRRENHSQSLIVALAQFSNKCSLETAKMIYSSSWGKYQIMGFNLYSAEIGLNKPIADYLNDESLQDSTFDKFIVSVKLDSCTPQSLADNVNLRNHFSLVYNGSLSYADELIESLQHYHFAIKQS